jgi:hypothetical protein
MRRTLPVILILALLPPAVCVAEALPTVRYSFDAALGGPGETARSDDGRLAWIIEGTDGHQLFVDGARRAGAEAIEQPAWTLGGELVYWERSPRGSRIHWGDRRGRLWDEIRTPDLEALSRANDPANWAWMDRGGARVVFAARDPNAPEKWVRLTRRPSQPGELERRPLTTSRIRRDDPDPGRTRTMALRYHLLNRRVPVYIGRRGKEECFVVGTREMACGARIEMIAIAPRTGRLLAAWRERDGEDLYLSDGLGTTGPWRRIDWASFSGDGLRYAVMVADRDGDRIQTGQGSIGSLGRLAALAHLADGALATLWFLPDRAALLAGERVVMEGAVVTRFMRPPAGDPVPVVLDREGYRVGVAADAPRARQIWGEGFLADGRAVAQITPMAGGQGLLAGGTTLVQGDALTGFIASADGSRILSVLHDRESGTESVWLDGRKILAADEVTGFGFVGAGPAARTWVHGRRGTEQCLWTSLDPAGLCCPSILGWTGAPAAPLLLCDGPDGPTMVAAEGSAARVDALPRSLLVAGPDGRILWFVTRDGSAWWLHGADGRRAPLPGVPRMVLTGPDAMHHPRLLIDGDDGSGWFTGRTGDRFSAEIAEMPHEIPGLGSVYASRRGGAVRWIGPTFMTPEADGLGSAPRPSDAGLSWWERRGARWVWVDFAYDVLD